MTLTYLCTLDLPDEWFAELAERVPEVEIHRLDRRASDPSPDLLAEVDLLHTSAWFPDAAPVPSLRCVQLDTSGVDHVRQHVAVGRPTSRSRRSAASHPCRWRSTR